MSDTENLNLSIADQKQLETLVAEAERNRSDAQRLALDASKLLSVTSNRLSEYKDRGFFKRCWYKISGKQDELDRANQADLIAMQKFAYVYLTKLQEQNLLEAKAIAVIRSNLKDLQDEVGEIHDMINVIVRKFDTRITKLENVTALQDWQIHINANEQQFCKDSRAICFIQLVFDYLGIMRKNNIPFDAIEGRPDLKLALKTFGIDVSATRSIGDFVQELFEGAERFGFKNLKELVTLRLEGEEISPTYILDNVTGAGFNALYAFVVEMDKMSALAKNLSESEENKAAMLKTILGAVNYAGTEYTPIELGMEILGGSLLAEEIYAQEKGISVVESEPINMAGGFDINDLLGGYVSISSHAFLDTLPTEDEKTAYLESFAVIYATLGGYNESNYLTSLTTLFGHKECLERIGLLTLNPKRIDVPALIRMLSSDERKYAWCVDAICLGNEDGKSHPKVKAAVLAMCKVFGYKENEISGFLDNVERFSLGIEPKSIFEAIKGIHVRTDAWRSYLDFKRISLKGAFDDIRKELSAVSFEGIKLSMEISKTSMDLSMSFCCFTMGDENFIQRTAINIERTSFLTKFDDFKKKVEVFSETASGPISRANGILSMFKIDRIEVPGGLFSVDADRATGIGNENWGDNMNNAFERLSGFVDGYSNAVEKLDSQLKLFEDGKYDESAEKNRQKKAEIEKAKKAAEKEHQKKATISVGDANATISFAFEKIQNLPFDFSNTRNIVFVSGKWVLFESNGLWASTDGSNWDKIKLPVEISYSKAIKEVNGNIVLWDDSEKEYFWSQDCANWNKSSFNIDDCYVKDVFFWHNQWWIQCKRYKKYSYKKEGIFWDSEETGTSHETLLFHADSLSAKWEEDQGFTLSTGYYIPDAAIGIVNDNMLAIRAVDSSYASNKHIADTSLRFMYADVGKWKVASLEGGDSTSSANDVSFSSVRDELVCSIGYGGVYHTPDGRNWTCILDMRGGTRFEKIGNVVCTFGRGPHGPTAFVSADGSSFSPVVVDVDPNVVSFNGTTGVAVNTSSNKGGLYRVKAVVS